MKKIKIIIIGLLILCVSIIISKNIIAKSALSAGIKAITGLRLSMQSMNVGIIRSLIDIKEMQLYNPPGFKDALMVNMPEIYIDYDLGAFLKKRVHFEEVRINLKDFIVVKNEEGQLNLDALNVVKVKRGTQPAQKKAKMPEIQIDELRLKIGRVIYRDYSRGAPPVEREFNLNIDEHHKNITDAYTLGSLIIVKALKNTAIRKLINFDLGTLQQGIIDTAQKALETSKETLNQTVQAVEQTIEETGQMIKEIIPSGE
ncbi:MAG: hypothetical protein PVI33_06110 [Candidatus Omnitrophota bacterium]|jgi:uncharacterized protein involved in outer membrane biogenesis